MLEQLKNIGLSENETKVYLAMLELGPSAVMDIARKAEVNRPTAYVQIESLKKRGLVSTQTKGKKQLYIAESPEHLENILDSKLHEIAVNKEELSGVLPQLISLYQSAGHRPTVRFFEGKEGLAQMQSIFFKSGQNEVLAVTALDDILAVFPNHLNTHPSQRVKKGISSKIIYSSSQGPILPSDPNALRESRFIPPDKMPFSGDVNIIGNMVAITALKGQISGVIIEHQAIVDSFLGFFNFFFLFLRRELIGKFP